MHTKTKNQSKTLKATLTLASLIIITACSTTKHRDDRLIENLEKQNAVIDAAESERQSSEVQTELQKSEVLLQAEARLVNALGAVKKANAVVISKMKPETKKECEHGKDEGPDDEQ